MTPIRVGLVGAGPHARSLHAPTWAAGPETTLTGVWSRRIEAATELAVLHSTRAATSFEELLDRSDVIAFAVAPEAQWQLAIDAARAGRNLVLEKPIADTVEHAQALADAVNEARVASLVVLTARFLPAVQGFLQRAATFPTTVARLTMLNGFLLTDPPPAPSWRTTQGVLYDLGPHVFDLITAAVGPATRIAGTGSGSEVIALQCDHDNGAVSQLTLSSRVGDTARQYRIELYGHDGVLDLDINNAISANALGDGMRRELHRTFHGTSTPLDVVRGLHLQQLLDAAAHVVIQSGTSTLPSQG